MADILIIDDDEGLRYSLSRIVRKMGHSPNTADSLTEGWQKVQGIEFDAIFLDVLLPDGNGLDLLPRLAGLGCKPEILIITGAGDADGAELAITNGAWDYIQKGDSPRQISLTLERALQYREQKLKAARTSPIIALKRQCIVGHSPTIRHCLDQVAQAAQSEANVLISGPTGTGKELFAQAIHANSPRSLKPFIVVDCASLPESLAEGLLFGHKKGSFTGADRDSQGLVMQADGGTLFLDEIGELPLHLQKAFLRVLQEKKIRPLGGKQEQKCNFRLVAATNRNLDQMIEDENFRSDLLFRVRSFSLVLPGLAERKEDIQEICTFHMQRICERMSIALKGFSSDFFEILHAYNWPGNVRELVQALEYSLAVARLEPALFPKHLPARIRAQVARSRVLSEDHPENILGDNLESMPPMQEFREQICSQAEREYLGKLLSLCQGKVKRACEVSGLSQSRLYTLIKKYELR